MLAFVVCALFKWDAFADHAAALTRDIDLQLSLLYAFMPELGRQAALLGQQEHARAAVPGSWSGACNLAGAVLHLDRSAWQRWLAAEPGLRSTSVLAAVASLTCAAPLSCSIGWRTSSTTPLLTMMELLACVCLQLRQAPATTLLGGSSVWRGQRHQQLAQQLMGSLRRLLEQLQLAAEAPAPRQKPAGAAAAAAAAPTQEAAGDAIGLVAAVLPAVVLLHHLISPETAGTSGKALFSLPQLPQWCSAASKALSSLAALAQLAESLPPSHPQRGQPSAVALALLDISTYIATDASSLAAQALVASSGRQPLGVTNPEAASQAHAALWQLHSTACRLAHNSSLLLRLPDPQHALGQLVELLDRVLNAAITVWTPLEQEAHMPEQ